MCPECNSNQFRRSQRNGTTERLYSWIKSGYYPYRCNNCGTRFWLSKQAADQVSGAVAAETPGDLQWEPVGFPPPDENLRKSQFNNQPKYRLRKWVWQRTRLEVETAILFLILGIFVLAGVWIAINQI